MQILCPPPHPRRETQEKQGYELKKTKVLSYRPTVVLFPD